MFYAYWFSYCSKYLYASQCTISWNYLDDFIKFKFDDIVRYENTMNNHAPGNIINMSVTLFMALRRQRIHGMCSQVS
jgi:hypothetical protein